MLVGKIKFIFRYIIGFIISLFLKLVFYEKFKVSSFKKANNVICIYFHNPTPQVFESVVKWMKKRNIQFISELDLLDFINQKKILQGSIWMTLDDGWSTNKDLIPIINKYEVPVTIFLTSSAIEAGFFWAPIFVAKGGKMDLSFHSLPTKEKYEIIQKIEIDNKSNFDRTALNSEEIISISKNKYISWGLHTHHHLATKYLGDLELFEEVKKNANYVSAVANKQILGFAYPHGIYSGFEEPILVDFNLKYAVTIKRSRILPNTERYFLPRYGYTPYSFIENISRIIGCW